MKIYFSASNRQTNKYGDTYKKIVKYLQNSNHEVYEKVLSDHPTSTQKTTKRNTDDWFTQWNTYVQQCDFAIIEGSYPSTVHVGFELGMILLKGKPVVLLHSEDADPVVIRQNYSPRLIKSEYSDKNIEETLDWAIDEVKQLSKKRFTFFISPEIEKFLDGRIACGTTTKSEYIRNLIKGQMEDC